MSAVVIDIEPLPSGDQYREALQRDVSELPRVPAPIYRHAAPSAPWPWMDFDADRGEVFPLPPGVSHDPKWSRYPQSLFGNWTRDQVERCGILKLKPSEPCKVHKVDVFDDGTFDRSDEERTFDVENPGAYWNHLETPPPENIRVRALFVENMTVPVLQILGYKYNVEPFFFASSANWIPSRYQEDPQPDGDHITVVLPFIRTIKNQRPIARTRRVRAESVTLALYQNQLNAPVDEASPYKDEKQIIDTQAPLLLPGDTILLQDLLAIHMHRTSSTSTIISYHPSTDLQKTSTSAKRLQFLVQRTGDSVYWSKIYRKSKDSTFLFLAILWYALYEWDEAFEVLYRYINTLESDVLKRNDIKLTRELHKLQAHLLYYQQLLRDFQVSVKFVRDIPNPAMSVLESSPEERTASKDLLCTETKNLMSEIERLTLQREMLSDRLENVINLAFATVNINESKTMQNLAKVTMIDSAAMKQIAYLTTVFLPAGFLANVFSMNVTEINPPTIGSMNRFIEVAVGLTVLTSWVAIALQKESVFHWENAGIVQRALWPIILVYRVISSVIQRALRNFRELKSSPMQRSGLN